jgi:leucine dehydrogenase
MTPFTHPEFDDHAEVAFCNDPESGLKAIIAIHNLNRGPALGGCRMWDYASEEEALTDALRLSRGMTYKSALANLPYGGGKSVIIGDPKTMKSEPLFRAMGRFVDSLGGRYIIAEDVGIGVSDVDIMAQETAHVSGASAGGVGDPSPGTAYGVYVGIRAAVKYKLGRDDLKGLTVAVQGLGHVGRYLCRRLAGAGAALIVTDIDRNAVDAVVDELGAKAVAPEEIYGVDAQVYAPCALVAGAANNQLAEPRHGAELQRRGVLYAPDYVINAGGVIVISHEGPRYDKAEAFAHIAGIHDTLLEIFRRADANGAPTSEAADRLAEERFKGPGLSTSAAA